MLVGARAPSCERPLQGQAPRKAAEAGGGGGRVPVGRWTLGSHPGFSVGDPWAQAEPHRLSRRGEGHEAHGARPEPLRGAALAERCWSRFERGSTRLFTSFST